MPLSNPPNNKLPGAVNAAVAAQLPEHDRRETAFHRAANTPLPGAVAEAFAPSPIRVGSLEFRPPVLGDFETLRLIESPLYEVFMLKAKGVADPELTVTQATDVIFLWTRPAREAR